MAAHIDQRHVGYTYEDIQATATEIMKHCSLKPKIAIICGTGLGGIAEAVADQTVVPYETIPGFPQSTVKGHAGKFVFGTLQDKPVLLMMGRLHYYEGYPMWKVAMPVRVMKAIGIETLLVTNASGGLNPEFKVGDLMILKDHIDLPGLSGDCVLIGKNDERFGPRFLATNSTYDKDLRKKFTEVMNELGHGDILRQGTYIMLGGPTFCSTAEARVLRLYGADACGMSTVPEAIVGRHSGMRVFGLSLITDTEDLTEDDEPSEYMLTHEEVLKTAGERATLLQKVFLKFVQRI